MVLGILVSIGSGNFSLLFDDTKPLPESTLTQINSNITIQQISFTKIHFKRWSSDTNVSITHTMMTSSNGNIFRVTGHLCGEFTGPGEFPAQRSVTRSFDVFFDLHPNKRLNKQWWGWRLGTPLCPLWRHRNAISTLDTFSCHYCHWLHCREVDIDFFSANWTRNSK